LNPLRAAALALCLAACGPEYAEAEADAPMPLGCPAPMPLGCPAPGRLQLVVRHDTVVVAPRPHRSLHLPLEVTAAVGLEYVCVLPPTFEPGEGGPPSHGAPSGPVRVGHNGRCHRVAPGHLVPRGAHWPGAWTVETSCPEGFDSSEGGR
jgi:hypothetical protein